MSIIARIRPSVEVKAHRVTKPRPVEFGAGILPTYPTDRPWERELRSFLAGLGCDVATMNAGVSWVVCRGSLTYFPCCDRQHWPAANAIVRKYAEAPVGFRDITPAPLPAPAPVESRPCRDYYRPYQPTDEDWAEYRELMDERDRSNREADLEMSYLAAAWSDRMSGIPVERDLMLAIGACG